LQRAIYGRAEGEKAMAERRGAERLEPEYFCPTSFCPYELAVELARLFDLTWNNLPCPQISTVPM
jgi:hypothetical protein